MTAQHGGSYILDPKTGERTLVERTVEPGETPIQAPAEPAPADTPENDTAAGGDGDTSRKRRAAAGKD